MDVGVLPYLSDVGPELKYWLVSSVSNIILNDGEVHVLYSFLFHVLAHFDIIISKLMLLQFENYIQKSFLLFGEILINY